MSARITIGSTEIEPTHESLADIAPDNDYGFEYLRAEAESWDVSIGVCIALGLFSLGCYLSGVTL